VRKVAILGWGSLLWNPGELRNRRQWQSDGPWLPIEFARTSNLNERNGRRPYLSLVTQPDVGLIRTYWDMSALTEILKARANLQTRENCGISEVACLPAEGAIWSSAVPGLESRVQDWLDRKKSDIDAVIWTNLDWKIPGVNKFTAEHAMNWLRALRNDGKSDTAEEYMRRAPSQTDTCVRRQAREEFGWTDIPTGY